MRIEKEMDKKICLMYIIKWLFYRKNDEIDYFIIHGMDFFISFVYFKIISIDK